ncbi:hypothetical protein ACSTS3_13415 [Aquimarina muelleri]|uniref:hypothetical protein n=1 Tax=Aquimarina muelleri TaxID=279356 RepID=UPI003F687900
MKIVSKAVLIGFFGMFIVSCEGEDGVNGIDGQAGVDGVSGENGINGENGVNGVGFEELTKYGAVTLNISGTRSDNVDFTHAGELKFTHNESGNNDVEFNDPNVNYSVVRFVNSPDSHDNSSVRLNLTVNDAGLSTQNFGFFVNFNGYSIISDDLKYFEISAGYADSNTSVSNFSITEYSFDEMTNNLKYTFTMTVAGANNITGNDMIISGTVDVIVLESLGRGPR